MRRLLLGSLFLALGLTMGCGGSGSGSSSSSSGTGSGTGTGTSGITVTISPKSVSLAAGGAQQFSATVANDPKHQGVDWTLTENGTTCSSGCGTISVSTSASGATTTYTAPATPISVILTATSVTDPTASASATISVAGGISVLVSPSTATVALGATASFTASVANDTSNKGVKWTLTQNGAACSPACGSLSATTSSSGNAITYTAPTSPPSSDTAILTATSVAAPSASSFATITIQGSTSVSVSPNYANVPVDATQVFTATVTGGTGSQAVNWQLTQNGKTCTPGCGSLSGSTTTTSNASVTYTAPSSAMTVTLTATSTANSKEFGSATIVVQPITVSVTPTFSNAYPSQLLYFTATVNNDVANKGVNWSLTENGSSCSPGCGTFSPTQTGAGVQTTYTAPSTVKSPAVLTVVASSVTNSKVTGTATIDLYPPITVSVSPTSATAAINSTSTEFTATVGNDPTASGVKWTLSQNGKDCTPGCGSVSPTYAAGNVVTTYYFAPSAVPSSSTVTLTATSAASVNPATTATAKITVSSTVTLKKLSGSYTLLMQGFDSAGAVAAAGSFTANGAGDVTGMLDTNRASGVSVAQPVTGTYTLSADNAGTLRLTSTSGAPVGTFHFALNAAGDIAQFVESDAFGTRGWGSFRKQTVSADSTAVFRGHYAFSASGADAAGARVALAGAFVADGRGKIDAGLLDRNSSGVLSPALAFAGSYSVSPSGRGTLAVATPSGVLHWAFYLVSPTEAYMVSTGDRTALPLTSGRILAQSPSSAEGFSTASLDGTSVLSIAGGTANGRGSEIAAGLVTFDGSGGLEFQMDRNDAGSTRTISGSGTYNVGPHGRVEISLPSLGQSLISYLVKPNQAMVVGTGSGASLGMLDARSAVSAFTDSSLSGRYILGTAAAPTPAASLEWGVVTSAGDGSLAGRTGAVVPSGSRRPLTGFSEAYSVLPSGRALFGNGRSVVYLISPSHAIVMDMRPGEANGTIRTIRK